MTESPVEALRALDRLYERLRDWEAQSQVLTARVAAESTVEDGAPVDALYRLAALDLRTSAKASQGIKLLSSAIDREPDFDRAEQILRAAADVHRDSVELLDLYEYVGRQPGRERALIDALTRRGDSASTDLARWREAAEIALSLSDTAKAEQLLQRDPDPGRSARRDGSDRRAHRQQRGDARVGTRHARAAGARRG